MLEFIFTIDYEIYGNGEGSLRELVFEPARKLKKIFDEAGAKFVVFVEAAELEKIDLLQTDPAIDDVKRQVREFYDEGFEIGLHLHPQWCNARYAAGKWELDATEYNLCTLPESRIDEIVGGSISYLRDITGSADFTPISFRAGNWLFQPTATAARVLKKYGIQVDSSVFKGGRQHKHDLDYRKTTRNGPYWRFGDDVTVSEPNGPLLEIPIHTEIVPFWKMITGKRIGLQQKGTSGSRSASQRMYRMMDLMRFWHPKKFDFCRMTLEELVAIIKGARQIYAGELGRPVPIVAIGHTKDLVEFSAIKLLLSYLKSERIPITTFNSGSTPAISSDDFGVRKSQRRETYSTK